MFQFLIKTLIVDFDVDEGAQARGITVVDAGCGAGNLAIALAGLLANLSVVDGEGGGRRRAVVVLAAAVTCASSRLTSMEWCWTPCPADWRGCLASAQCRERSASTSPIVTSSFLG